MTGPSGRDGEGGTRSTRAAGAGLGLSIVSAVATAHGGRAEVTSTPGRGTTFVVTLPLWQSDARDHA